MLRALGACQGPFGSGPGNQARGIRLVGRLVGRLVATSAWSRRAGVAAGASRVSASKGSLAARTVVAPGSSLYSAEGEVIAMPEMTRLVRLGPIWCGSSESAQALPAEPARDPRQKRHSHGLKQNASQRRRIERLAVDRHA